MLKIKLTTLLSPHLAIMNFVDELRVASRAGNMSSVVSLLIQQVVIKVIDPTEMMKAYYIACEVHQALIAHFLDEKDTDLLQRLEVTALHQAAYQGDQKKVIMLLDNGVDPNVEGQLKVTPLYEAAYRGHAEIVQILLDRGANPNRVSNEIGVAPLYQAVCEGHQKIVENLLNKGADPNIQNFLGLTPLYHATYKAHVPIVEMLLHKGANPDMPSQLKVSPLHEAVSQGNNVMVEMLLAKGADINNTKIFNETPLYLAATENQEQTVALLLHWNASLDLQDEDGNTPLHEASYMGHTAIVAMLLDKGAALHLQNVDGETPLHRAAEEGHRIIVQMLLNKDISLSFPTNQINSLNRSNIYGLTPLHIAAQNGCQEVMQILLDKGAGIYFENAVGNIPFTEISSILLEDPIQTIQSLLQHGVYAYRHTSADQNLYKECCTNITINDAGDMSFYTSLLLAGISIDNQLLPESLAAIYHQIEATIIQWLTPLKMRDNRTVAEATVLARASYQAMVPFVLRALPRLIRWIHRVSQVEAARQERAKQGYRETLEEILLVFSAKDKYLEENVRAMKEMALHYLQMDVFPTELLVLIRENLIHKTLVATLLKVHHEVSREIANYLVAEVRSAPDICNSFYKQLFQHPWPTPYEAPMTPQVQRMSSVHTKSL